MTSVDLGFAAAAVIVGLIGYRSPRVLMWLGVGALSYTTSAIYWRLGLPYGEAIAGLCDAAVCLAVYFAGKYRWEMWVWRLFQLSVAINLVYLMGSLGVVGQISHDAYAISLEAINASVLIFLGGSASLQRLGRHGMAGRAWGGIRRAVFSLREERSDTPFTKA